MNQFIQFFDCGNVNVRITDNRCDFYVQDLNKIINNIIPHFDNYPLQNIKHLDFADLKKAAELYKTDGSRQKNLRTDDSAPDKCRLCAGNIGPWRP
jgi:hypothetical protein